MSRDFALYLSNIDDSNKIENILIDARILGHPDQHVFSVDNRGDSLFVTLVWSEDIAEDAILKINGVSVTHFRSRVGFVAVKNGHHNPIGYFLDTAEQKDTCLNPLIPVTEIFNRIVNHSI